MRRPQHQLRVKLIRDVHQVILLPDDSKPAVLVKALGVLYLRAQRGVKRARVLILQVELEVDHVRVVHVHKHYHCHQQRGGVPVRASGAPRQPLDDDDREHVQRREAVYHQRVDRLFRHYQIHALYRERQYGDKHEQQRGVQGLTVPPRYSAEPEENERAEDDVYVPRRLRRYQCEVSELKYVEERVVGHAHPAQETDAPVHVVCHITVELRSRDEEHKLRYPVIYCDRDHHQRQRFQSEQDYLHRGAVLIQRVLYHQQHIQTRRDGDIRLIYPECRDQQHRAQRQPQLP